MKTPKPRLHLHIILALGVLRVEAPQPEVAGLAVRLALLDGGEGFWKVLTTLNFHLLKPPGTKKNMCEVVIQSL